MVYVYVLKRLKNNKRYVGCTKLHPNARLKQHNQGSNTWTKHNGPFELAYQEEHLNITEARKREKFLKSGEGRSFLNFSFSNQS